MYYAMIRIIQTASAGFAQRICRTYTPIAATAVRVVRDTARAERYAANAKTVLRRLSAYGQACIMSPR
ncbi:hypothetical protein l11_16020 [Neisseria weaveri LMG 5135]|nr:hypothetical protein l11_16020 [Neisseria weaveri LMG 5135]